MAEALYTKYRPQVFNDMVGQEHIERTIKNAIEHDKVSHAYLFTGPRGTGKTTTARLLAKALLCDQGPTAEPDGTCENCELIAQSIHPDVSELDAASRTGVDNVREEIIGRVNYAPTRGRYKVYIIDEVHMLSTAAFNALLKTLEEPPSHVVFILCTTDPQKVPETIHSRCQRFDFHRISIEAMVSRLGAICVSEGVEFEGDALELVAHRADGGMRNALTSLEQLIAFGDGKVTLESAERLLGSLDSDSMAEIVAAIGKRNAAACFTWVANYIETGADLAQFANDLAEHIRDLYILSLTNAQVDLPISDANRQIMTNELQWFGPDRLSRLLVVLGDLNKELRTSLNTRLSFEIALTRMIRPESDVTLEALAERIEVLERNYSAETFFSSSADGSTTSASVAQVPAVPVPVATFASSAESTSSAPAPAPVPVSSTPSAPVAAAPVTPVPAAQPPVANVSAPATPTSVAPAPAVSAPSTQPAQKQRLSLNNLNAALSSMRNNGQASAPLSAPAGQASTAFTQAPTATTAMPSTPPVSDSVPVPTTMSAPNPAVPNFAAPNPATPSSAVPNPVAPSQPSQSLQPSASVSKSSIDLSDPAAVQRLWHQTTQRMNKVNPTHGILFINGKPSADPSGSRLIVTYAKDSAAVFPLLSTPAMHTLLSETLAEIAGAPVPFELVLDQPDAVPASMAMPSTTPIASMSTSASSSMSAPASGFGTVDASASAPAPVSAPNPVDIPPADIYDTYAASYSDPSEPDYGYGAYGDPSEPDYQPPVQSDQPVQPMSQPVPQQTPQQTQPISQPAPQPAQPAYQTPAANPSQASSEPSQAVDESQRVKDLLTDVFGTGITFENLPPE